MGGLSERAGLALLGALALVVAIIMGLASQCEGEPEPVQPIVDETTQGPTTGPARDRTQEETEGEYIPEGTIDVSPLPDTSGVK